jgi:eukaryotic-like serine/threonine-protein kinase
MVDIRDASTEADDRLGEVLDDAYVLEEVLGIGGAAVVYSASADLGRTRVAIKVLHRSLTEIPEVRTRFVREAKVPNMIPHAGVVRVLGQGECSDGSPYLVLELLEGESVEDRADRKGGRLPLKEVLYIADQTLDVLAAAHKKSIVHRDVKPENIYLTFDRKVKLLDFGIAGLKDLAAASDEATRIGTVLGTPAFMSPEQARGDWAKVGIHADLWAVGATMYTLLSGHLVHEETRLFEQLRAAVSTPATSLAVVAPDVPSPIVNLIDFALEFDQGHRWPNARAMQNALRMAYGEWHRSQSKDPNAEAMEITEPPLLFEKPDAPPMSLARPPRRG